MASSCPGFAWLISLQNASKTFIPQRTPPRRGTRQRRRGRKRCEHENTVFLSFNRYTLIQAAKSRRPAGAGPSKMRPNGAGPGAAGQHRVATCQESRNSYNDLMVPNDFMGPTLYDGSFSELVNSRAQPCDIDDWQNDHFMGFLPVSIFNFQ